MQHRTSWPEPHNDADLPEAARLRIASLEGRVAELEAQINAYQRSSNFAAGGRLNILLSVSAALLVTHDLETILNLVVRESAQLFPGAVASLLFLADEGRHKLLLRASSVAIPPGIAVSPADGLPGRGFLTPRAMLVVGPEVEEALSACSPVLVEHLSRVVQPWPPLSALIAPLRTGNERLGSLVCYGGTHAHLFHPRDLPFIQALADLSAAAIDETLQRARTAALQRDLDQSQSLHAEAQARLDAAQAQLLQSAKLAAVGELAASVAHEINNPLYAARNSLYLVAQDLPADSPQRPFLDIAQGELGRIARIITRMRDFYRPAHGELEPTDVNALLSETVELVQTHLRHGHVQVELELDSTLPSLIAHGDQIRQVFLNLMLNACDAMPDGGTLRVRTANNGADAVVRIADTGVGIAPEHRVHLFEPFYTTKPHGTGLGLTISAHIITQHGGRITVDSEVGAGTTFEINLPIAS
ncbi:MAG: GAF domain-containing sensor histidine kinase [Roseiflexaceae bacterium]